MLLLLLLQSLLVLFLLMFPLLLLWLLHMLLWLLLLLLFYCCNFCCHYFLMSALLVLLFSSLCFPFVSVFVFVFATVGFVIVIIIVVVIVVSFWQQRDASNGRAQRTVNQRAVPGQLYDISPGSTYISQMLTRNNPSGIRRWNRSHFHQIYSRVNFLSASEWCVHNRKHLLRTCGCWSYQQWPC